MDNLNQLEQQLKELLLSDSPRDEDYHSLRKKIHYLKNKEVILKKSKKYTKKHKKSHRKHCNDYASNHFSVLKVKGFVNRYNEKKPYSTQIFDKFISWFYCNCNIDGLIDIEAFFKDRIDGTYTLNVKDDKVYELVVENHKIIKFKQKMNNNLFSS